MILKINIREPSPHMIVHCSIGVAGAEFCKGELSTESPYPYFSLPHMNFLPTRLRFRFRGLSSLPLFLPVLPDLQNPGVDHLLPGHL